MAAWTHNNLGTQGYRLSAAEARQLRIPSTMLASLEGHRREEAIA